MNAHVHLLQHAYFEGPGAIADWTRERGHDVTHTRLYRPDEELPKLDGIDLLVILGGPMSVHDEKRHPWLVAEKAFIRGAVERGTRVLGICLGAQLMAEAMGARVYPNPEREIGWFPVERTDESAGPVPGSEWMPAELTAFHWHGETFDVPPGCAQVARSKGCEVQAFQRLSDSGSAESVGLQFHLESTAESIEALISACPADLAEGAFVQTAEKMRAGVDSFAGAAHRQLFRLLDRMMR